MSSSARDFDASSLASDATLLRDKGQATTSHSKYNKRSLLDRLSGSRRDTSSATKSSTLLETSSATNKTDDKKTSSTAVEDLYRAYRGMGTTNTRLT